jgi:hypothetical protein
MVGGSIRKSSFIMMLVPFPERLAPNPILLDTDCSQTDDGRPQEGHQPPPVNYWFNRVCLRGYGCTSPVDEAGGLLY